MADERLRCDACGKFRKPEDVRSMATESEEWNECKSCMSQSDFEESYPDENRARKECE